MPPGPENLDILHATNSTASSVMLMEIKMGVFSYVSYVALEGIVLLIYFPSKTDVTVSLIVPVRSSANSYGNKNPPFSLSKTNWTDLHNFPFETRFENVLCYCSSV